MLNRFLLLATLTAALSPLAFAADGTFDRTLTFSGSPTLSVSTGSGYIHVYPGKEGEVHIIGRVHSRPGLLGGDADDRVRQIVAAPPIVQSGNIVTVGESHSDSDLMRNISIDYEVTAPSQTSLKSHSGSGSLEIGGILGTVNAQSGSGSIHADNVGGNSRFSTGSGSIHAEHVHGAANADTGSGRIELSVTAPGDVQVRTGSGSIELNGISGGLRASAGSGSITVAGNPSAEWRLDSGSGSIHLKLEPYARFTLNASTGSGGVKVDRPIVMQGSLEKHHVTGTVNGGGPTLRASTGSGAITIE